MTNQAPSARSTLPDPTLSVLVVTYNREQELRRCLDSILGQDELPDEIVVLNNNSADASADMVTHEYPTVRLVTVDSNLGCPAGRNRGVEECTGDYILFVDDDGTLAPGSVEAVRKRITTDTTVSVIAGVCLDAYHPPLEAVTEGPCFSFSGGICVMHRETFINLGGYHEDGLRQGEEGELSFKLFDSGYRIYSEPNLILHHHIESTRSRDRLIVRSSTRQVILTSVRFVPLPIIAPWIAWKLVAHFRMAVSKRTLSAYFSGLSDASRLVPHAIRSRSRASYRAVAASTRWYQPPRFSTQPQL